ncbi:hypothetical protein H0H87_012807 [Tephrocybe sp. NHM501043]|nr:hypothetical protein H0H87_012807 [Tephrocybe sp. NHM501043]
MPEYVYALHDFLPENDDEVPFHAGERIEVVEKDDLYGDGWWQGRNLAGRIGLFPQSYTTSAPPATTTAPTPTLAASSSTDSAATEMPASTTLHALHEEPEPDDAPTPSNISTNDILAPIPQNQAPATFLNNSSEISASPTSTSGPADSSSTSTAGPEPEPEPEQVHKRTISSGEEVMALTMTDVQQAIEQLGRGRNGHGEGDEVQSMSFSFASTRGDGEGTDTEYDMSDADSVLTGGAATAAADGENWHKGARTKLAEKARRAVEEAEKLEAIMSGSSLSAFGRAAPPIEVEMSDESDDEGAGEYTTHTHASMKAREHPYIPEEEEEEDGTGKEVNVPERDEYEAQTATATKSSFLVFQPPPQGSLSAPPTATATATPESTTTSVESKRTSVTNDREGQRESPVALPGSFPSAEHSKHNSVASASASAAASGLSLPPLTSFENEVRENGHGNMQAAEKDEEKEDKDHGDMQAAEKDEEKEDKEKEKEKTHPSEWDVSEVVEWLKSKGFDSDVCDKFTEQEITGDVLLELDVNLLKTEIGIMAFGKRMRIANAITDLRRPPSIVYSEHVSFPLTATSTNAPLSPTYSQGHSSQQGHSRHQSQAYSHHSFPGSISGGANHNNNNSTSVGVGQVYVGAGSPPVYASNGSVVYAPVPEAAAGGYLNGIMHQGHGGLEPPHMGLSASAPVVQNGNGNGNVGRPLHLMLSPSDGALKASAAGVLAVAGVSPREEEEEDRGAASESEVTGPSTNMRRRLFGRSYDSASSKLDSAAASRHSKEESMSLSSPGVVELSKKDSKRRGGKEGREKEKDEEKDRDSLGSLRPRSKKSADGGSTGKSGGERLSIFGTTFGGTLGKGRKPPPRFTASAIDETGTEKEKEKHSHSPHSMFTLPRLTSGSKSKSSTEERPASSSGVKPKPTSTVLSNSTPKPNKTTIPKSTLRERDPALLRKRTSSAPAPPTEAARAAGSALKPGQSILEQIGEADFKGWMRKKGDRYNSWKLSNAETKIKGYVNIVGYKVTVDENVNPGRYGFRIEHDHDKTHYFSSDEKTAIRDWMKAIMKATIGRDYTKPVISSCNIPTIPLMVAQAMNPAPRPPSPTARAATQKALRREDTNSLSTRDARVLMGLSSPDEGIGAEERTRLPSFFANDVVGTERAKSPVAARTSVPAPARPSREMRRSASIRPVVVTAEDSVLIEWANSHLPDSLQIRDSTGSICGGLALLRIAEGVKGKPASPPVLDSAFPQSPTDDKLDGLFKLFDFLLDNDVKMGSVSINDVRSGKRDKILQLLRALKAWEDKRRALASTIGTASSVQSGGFMAPVVWG